MTSHHQTAADRPRQTPAAAASSPPPRPAPAHWASHLDAPVSTALSQDAAPVDDLSSQLNARLSHLSSQSLFGAAPPFTADDLFVPNDDLNEPHDTDDPTLKTCPDLPRFHVRNPSTQVPLMTPSAHDEPQTSGRDGSAGDSLRHSATAPIAIRDGYLRSTFSAETIPGSLSPGSALSSPALNALVDLTPLPSPLVISESPAAFLRGAAFRPRSRGASGSSRDDSFLFFGRNTLSPSPSLKKKGYERLKMATAHAAEQREEADQRKRSLSEFRPDAAHNTGSRHVSISNIAPQVQTEGSNDSQLHREKYLAAKRGLIPAATAGLPTPPASNRSVTESEEEDVADKSNYVMIRQGPQMAKKPWRLVRLLGQGTFSKVWLATSEKVEAKDPLDEATLDYRKLVAVKVSEHGPAGGADSERIAISLKREVEMLRSVSHPSLVRMRAFEDGETQAMLVLTYCPGGDLFDIASSNRDVLSADLVQRIFAELVSATRYLHENLVVHRDIKLENVLLNIPVATVPLLKNPQSHPYPIVTLTDLGLSRRIPAPPESPLLNTRCGSEDYAAPEILLGQPYDGRQTDAWAMGVLLYALMEGRLPFDTPPGKPVRSRPMHRICRCDWQWNRFGDSDDEWDPEKGKDWEGARLCVEGLLKKVSRGRKSLDEIAKFEWVQQGIRVEGGIKRRIEDDEPEEKTPDFDAR